MTRKSNSKEEELATIPLPDFDTKADMEKFIEAIASGHVLENKELIDRVLDRHLDRIEAELRAKGKNLRAGNRKKKGGALKGSCAFGNKGEIPALEP